MDLVHKYIRPIFHNFKFLFDYFKMRLYILSDQREEKQQFC